MITLRMVLLTKSKKLCNNGKILSFSKEKNKDWARHMYEVCDMPWTRCTLMRSWSLMPISNMIPTTFRDSLRLWMREPITSSAAGIYGVELYQRNGDSIERF